MGPVARVCLLLGFLLAFPLFLAPGGYPAAARVSCAPSLSSLPGRPRDVEAFAPAPNLAGFTSACSGPDAYELQKILGYWNNVLSRHSPEAAFGNSIRALPPPVLRQWQNLSRLMPSWTAEKKLQNINGFFNCRESKTDQENYGVEEYWACPEEFLEKGGDCEDFAIAKYLALRYFGWPEQDLWILLVRESKTGKHHAVLAARTGEKTFILDNLSRPVYLLIPDKQYLRTVTPLYAVNSLGAWALVKALSGGRSELPAGNAGR